MCSKQFFGGCLPQLSVLYYKGIFIAGISDAVSSHPVSPRLCTPAQTEKKSKTGIGGLGGLSRGKRETRELVK